MALNRDRSKPVSSSPVWLAFTLALIGCPPATEGPDAGPGGGVGGGSGGGGGGGGGGSLHDAGVLTGGSWCRQRAQEVCETLVDCGRLHLSLFAECREHYAAQCPQGYVDAVLDAGVQRFNPAAARECLDRGLARVCYSSSDFAAVRCAPFDAVGTAGAPCLSPTQRSPHAAVVSFEQCGPGHYCADALSCPSGCVSYQPVGADCGGVTAARCDPRFGFCELIDGGPAARCTAFRALGEGCGTEQCGPGALCVRQLDGGAVCRRGLEGDACEVSLEEIYAQCAFGYLCGADAGCMLDPTYAVDDAGTCRNEYSCGYGSWCERSDAGPGTCVVAKPAGAACRSHRECTASTLCVGLTRDAGRCVPWAAPGEACTEPDTGCMAFTHCDPATQRCERAVRNLGDRCVVRADAGSILREHACEGSWCFSRSKDGGTPTDRCEPYRGPGAGCSTFTECDPGRGWCGFEVCRSFCFQ